MLSGVLGAGLFVVQPRLLYSSVALPTSFTSTSTCLPACLPPARPPARPVCLRASPFTLVRQAEQLQEQIAALELQVAEQDAALSALVGALSGLRVELRIQRERERELQVLYRNARNDGSIRLAMEICDELQVSWRRR